MPVNVKTTEIASVMFFNNFKELFSILDGVHKSDIVIVKYHNLSYSLFCFYHSNLTAYIDHKGREVYAALSGPVL